MKTILDISALRFPLTGIGRYTYELARHLQDGDLGIEPLFLSGSMVTRALPGIDQAAGEAGAGKRRWDLRQFARNSHWLLRAFRAYTEQKQARALKGHEDAVFHGPQFYLPAFGGRKVVTIHDLSVFKWPQCHPPARVAVIAQAIERAVNRADHLITDSEFTRGEIADYFGISTERITATPLAHSEAFKPRDAAETEAVLQRYRLTHNAYCLFSGTIEPRKNLETLLQAYAKMPIALRHRHPLVICGYHGWQSDRLHEQIEKACSAGWAHYLGYVSNAELPVLFAGARLFAFPSLYEGFGLPVLEAMASGVPVVCSDSASLPEVVGPAAAMISAQDACGLSRLLEQGLLDEQWRLNAQKAGLNQAGRFSWARCARLTVGVYKNLYTETHTHRAA